MRVDRVGFTSVKGTRHTAREEIELDADGAVGDRLFCAVDLERRRVLRTVQNPSLVGVRSRWDGTRLEVTLPSGEVGAGTPAGTGEHVACDYWGRSVELSVQDGPYAALFSSYLGFPVVLAEAPRAGVIYGNPVSIVTTATLAALGDHLGGADLDPARFRATVVLDAGDRPFHEEEWLGRELRLGQARVRLAAPIPRCAVIDLHPDTGERDGRLLKGLATLRPDSGPEGPVCGVDAHVTVPGVVRPGDPVELLD
jgi:uncharacterized protein YcbX